MTPEEADRRWRRIGALLAAVGVALGAFGAHALGDHPRVETWKTAAHYQLLHGIALCLPGLPGVTRGLLVAGVLLFAGSLYALVLSGFTPLGMVTPLGGVCFIAGWAVAAWRRA